MQRKEGHEPTPEQIAEECRRIRQSWSPRDYRVRSGISPRRLEVRRAPDPSQLFWRQ